MDSRQPRFLVKHVNKVQSHNSKHQANKMDHTRDIDDILREVEAEFSTGPPQHDGDLEALTAAWVAERSAPELLEYISRILF